MATTSDPPSPQVTLRNAVAELEIAARTQSKQRAVKITGLLDKVATRAYEEGLTEELLDKLVDIITLPNELDQASVAIIIRNLYPASKISDEVVIKVVGSLGHGKAKAAFPAQAALLKWLVMVYDILENTRILSQLYSLLFNLLDTIAIRLELARRVGHEPQLTGLIRIYKDYYPDVLVGDVTHGRASVFTHPDPEWRKRLIEIQEANAHRIQEGLLNRQHPFRVVRRGVNGLKRGKVSGVPEVHTFHAQESSVTLEEIENISDFVQKLEKIEMPNQLVAVIGDPLLQHLLHLKSNKVIVRRIDNWLTAFFEDQLESGAQTGSTPLLDMLSSIRDYTSFAKTIPSACLVYLQSLLRYWNGVEGRDIILDLLTYIHVAPFEELYQSSFQYLEFAILDHTPDSQLALLKFYTSLLRQWTVTFLSSTPPPVASNTIIALTTHANTLALTLLQNSPTTPTHQSILSFYETTAFLISRPTLQSHVRITTPPSELVYSLHFSSSLSTVSRLCAILAIYKRAFESAMAKPATAGESSAPQIESYPTAYVNLFNGFLMDICNCLWRSRAFNTSDTNALGCLLPPALFPALTAYVAKLDTGLALPSLFSLSYSPILCNLSISYVRELEDQAEEAAAKAGTTTEGVTAGQDADVLEGGIQIRHAGPVTQRSLMQLGKDGGLKLSWPNYRSGVLTYLEGKGVMGVGELMYNTLKHLMNAREGAVVATKS